MGHFSDYLSQHPRTAGMSAGEFGRLVGISKNTANELLQGRSLPQEGTLEKISRAFAELPLAKMRELVLLDTPVEIPDIQRLNLKQRALIRALVDELVGASENAPSLPSTQPTRREAGVDNVVQMPQSDRVRKAAYNPPGEE